MAYRRDERRHSVAYKEGMARLVVGYAKDVARAIKIIQQHYSEVDGHKVSKAEVFRRAVIILANEITKGRAKYEQQ